MATHSIGYFFVSFLWILGSKGIEEQFGEKMKIIELKFDPMPDSFQFCKNRKVCR